MTEAVEQALRALVPSGANVPALSLLSRAVEAVWRGTGRSPALPSPRAWTELSALSKRSVFEAVLRCADKQAKLGQLVEQLRQLPAGSWEGPLTAVVPEVLARRQGRREPEPKRIRLMVRVVDGQVVQFDGSPLPPLADTTAELILPLSTLRSAAAREAMEEWDEVELLPAGAVLRCRVAVDDTFSPESGPHVFHYVARDWGAGAFIEVIVDEPVKLRTRLGASSRLSPVRCRVPSLNDRECASLNEAYKVISERFEPWRRSSGGNAFLAFHYLDDKTGLWGELDELRSALERMPLIERSSEPVVASTGFFTRPAVVAAADWSVREAGRAVAVARLDGASYVVDAPAPVGDPGTLLSHLEAMADGGGLLLGFDFPIGLPISYAQRAGVASFREGLRLFGEERFAAFYDVSDTPSLAQPFYPASPSGSHARLVDSLHLDSADQLRRRCEWRAAARGQASPLFFTLGAAQVGRAACHGWRHVLAPRQHLISLWPFDGGLDELLAKRGTTIAEIYPAEAYHRLGIADTLRARGGKRNVEARRAAGEYWLTKFSHGPISLGPGVAAQVARGFSSDDEFDAVAALLGMLLVVTGLVGPTFPSIQSVREVEGWIFGLGWA